MFYFRPPPIFVEATCTVTLWLAAFERRVTSLKARCPAAVLELKFGASEFRQPRGSDLAKPVNGTVRKARVVAPLAEEVAESGIREGPTVAVHKEGQIARRAGVNDPLKFRNNRDRQPDEALPLTLFSPGIWWIGSRLIRSGSEIQPLQMYSWVVRPLSVLSLQAKFQPATKPGERHMAFAMPLVGGNHRVCQVIGPRAPA